MNPLAAIGVAGLTFLAAAGPAEAFSFSPTHRIFVASGPVTLRNGQGSIKCTMEIKGKNKAGRPEIFFVAFFGVASCSNTAAMGLPWRVLATGPSAGEIENVGLTGAFLGSCGPATVPINVGGAGTGVWSMRAAHLPPDCKISDSLPTTPANDHRSLKQDGQRRNRPGAEPGSNFIVPRTIEVRAETYIALASGRALTTGVSHAPSAFQAASPSSVRAKRTITTALEGKIRVT